MKDVKVMQKKKKKSGLFELQIVEQNKTKQNKTKVKKNNNNTK